MLILKHLVINTSGGINLKSFKSNKLKSNVIDLYLIWIRIKICQIFIQEIRSSREENEPRKFIDKSKLNACITILSFACIFENKLDKSNLL